MKSNAECCKQGKLDGQRALGGDKSKFFDDDGLGELDGEGVRERDDGDRIHELDGDRLRRVDAERLG